MYLALEAARSTTGRAGSPVDRPAAGSHGASRAGLTAGSDIRTGPAGLRIDTCAGIGAA